VKLKAEINNNLDIIVEISSKIERELFEELNKTFPEEDILTLKKIGIRR